MRNDSRGGVAEVLRAAAPPGAAVAVRRGPVALAVVILVLTQLMFVVDTSIVNVALPDIGRELGFSSAGLSWVVTAYALTFGGLILLSGKVGSMIGPRRALLLGVVVFVIASIAGGLAPSAGVLVAARALQGVGAAMAAPSVMVLLMGITSPGPQRSRASGWPGQAGRSLAATSPPRPSPAPPTTPPPRSPDTSPGSRPTSAPGHPRTTQPATTWSPPLSSTSLHRCAAPSSPPSPRGWLLEGIW